MAKLAIGTLVLSGGNDGAGTLTLDNTVTGSTASLAGTISVAPGGELFFLPTSSGDKSTLASVSDAAASQNVQGET